MYKNNFECNFKTEKGSVYNVTNNYLNRHKYDGTEHNGSKNIFYVSNAASDEMLKMLTQKSFDQFKVENENDEWSITFYKASTEVQAYKIGHEPQLGLYPIDMLLKNDGWNEEVTEKHAYIGRFHPGDKIIEFL